jgi:superfamily II DNA or RNA helicase
MLTEGVDLPSAGTVFLARPTASDILLSQMTGRALRGEPAGGAAVAHILTSSISEPISVISSTRKT